MKRPAGLKKAVAALTVVLGLVAAMPNSPVGANGTETLGPPAGIQIAQGTGIVTNGTGMFAQPAVVPVTIPVNATATQVLIYWEGYHDTDAGGTPDGTITVNGGNVAGQLIGGPTRFFSNVYSSSWRADITDVVTVNPGLNNFTLSGLSFNYANNGASIAIIYDDHSGPADIQIRDGNDLAYIEFPEPLNATTPQVFPVVAAAFDRVADLSLLVGGVATGRPSIVRVSSGAVSQDYPNLLGNTDGPEWDDVTLQATIPAGATSVRVEILSQAAPGQSGQPASLAWVAAILEMAGAAGNCPPPVPTQAITHGAAYGADARILGGLITLDRLGYVHSVAPGAPSAEAKKLLTANVPLLVSAKVLPTSSHSKLDPSTSTSSAAVAEVNLLNGLVKAATVKSVSQSTASQFGSSYNSNGSTIVGLTVAGANVNVAPNTSVAVKVLGIHIANLYVMEEKGTKSFGNGVSSSSHSMNALRLVLLKSYLGFPVGTQVTLAHAESDAQSPMSGCPDVRSVSGEAFTAYVDGNLLGHNLVDLKVGDAVLEPTGGSDSDGTIVNVPGVAFSATAANTTSGALNPNPNATSRSIVEGVNVLNGLIRARVLDVKATSFATGASAGTTFNSTLVDLFVGGIKVEANAKPNTHLVVDLGALGYVSVTVNEQIANNGSATDTEGTINALHVRAYTLGGVLTGEAIIASAHSDAHV